MHLLTAGMARRAAFDCETWSKLATNATRDEIVSGGYVHDIYQAPYPGDFQHAVDLLLAYQVFAPHRMIHHVCAPGRRVALGATIVQRVVFGLVAVEAGVRVVEFEQSADRASFAYATLQGHPERGIASFSVVRNGNSTKFEAQAWSRAGSWLTIAGRPLSRALQTAITREAVASFCAS